MLGWSSFPILVSEVSKILLNAYNQQKQVHENEGDQDIELFYRRST